MGVDTKFMTTPNDDEVMAISRFYHAMDYQVLVFNLIIHPLPPKRFNH
jgi:hypothetical protein